MAARLSAHHAISPKIQPELTNAELNAPIIGSLLKPERAITAL